MLLNQDSKAFGAKRVLTQGLEVFGVRVEEDLVHETFILLHAALCVCVANNLRMICNEILESKEYPLGMFFGQHASFWSHMKVLVLLLFL